MVRKYIDRAEIKLKMKMKDEIGNISDPTFVPIPRSRYETLPEPFRSQAMAQFDLRKINVKEYKNNLAKVFKEDILQYGYTEAYKRNSKLLLSSGTIA